LPRRQAIKEAKNGSFRAGLPRETSARFQSPLRGRASSHDRSAVEWYFLNEEEFGRHDIHLLRGSGADGYELPAAAKRQQKGKKTERLLSSIRRHSGQEAVMKLWREFIRGVSNAVLADLAARFLVISWTQVAHFLGHIAALVALHAKR
jgi:hypothetical protein